MGWSGYFQFWEATPAVGVGAGRSVAGYDRERVRWLSGARRDGVAAAGRLAELGGGEGGVLESRKRRCVCVCV